MQGGVEGKVRVDGGWGGSDEGAYLLPCLAGFWPTPCASAQMLQPARGIAAEQFWQQASRSLLAAPFLDRPPRGLEQVRTLEGYRSDPSACEGSA